jgi:hypothetical protein
MPISEIFNHNTICIEGDLVFPRVYAALYPSTEFVEDARPDYYIQKTEFDKILQEVYGTIGRPIYKSFISGKCLELRLIDEFKTLFFVTFLIGEDLVDRKYRLSSKDLAFANEMGMMAEIQEGLDNTTAKEYNARDLAPIVSEEELIHAVLTVFYYPVEFSDKGKAICTKYNELKFDRDPKSVPTDNAIYTLGQNNNGLMLNKHFLDTSKYKGDIIESNYNDNFAVAYDKIIQFLKSDDNGLLLFTGEPGTGKSSLLMHLTTVCKDLNTRFVFIPAAFASILSDPTFLPFAIASLNNSVLILEDAEEVLKDRGAGGSGAISNILNVTDGILGKIVKVKIIATVNKTHVIDLAIVRKGRLKLQYAFEKLTAEKANKLYIKLGKEKETKVPMTLAEIYNTDAVVVTPIIPKRNIGFQNN